MKEVFVLRVNGLRKRKKLIGKKRNNILNKLLTKHRSKNKTYDCITTGKWG